MQISLNQNFLSNEQQCLKSQQISNTKYCQL